MIAEKASASIIIKAVDAELENIIGEDLPILKDIKKFVVNSGGKRIRPLLLCLTSDLYEAEKQGSRTLAAITEIIHAASLLHDDVLDDSETRRGKPSGKSIFGSKEVILGGDYLLACGIKRLNEFQNQKLMSIFTKVIHDLSVAELLQMEYETNPDINFDIYYKIIYGKTASLFEAACEAAAVWANLNEDEFYNLSALGKNLGLFFQIRDDYLDYYNASLLKKNPFQDFQRGIYTYPVIVLKNNSRESEKIQQYFEKSIEERKNSQIQNNFLDILTESGSKQKTEEKLKNLSDDIIKSIEKLPQKPSKNLIQSQFEKLLNY